VRYSIFVLYKVLHSSKDTGSCVSSGLVYSSSHIRGKACHGELLKCALCCARPETGGDQRDVPSSWNREHKVVMAIKHLGSSCLWLVLIPGKVCPCPEFNVCGTKAMCPCKKRSCQLLSSQTLHFGSWWLRLVWLIDHSPSLWKRAEDGLDVLMMASDTKGTLVSQNFCHVFMSLVCDIIAVFERGLEVQITNAWLWFVRMEKGEAFLRQANITSKS